MLGAELPYYGGKAAPMGPIRRRDVVLHPPRQPHDRTANVDFVVEAVADSVDFTVLEFAVGISGRFFSLR